MRGLRGPDPITPALFCSMFETKEHMNLVVLW